MSIKEFISTQAKRIVSARQDLARADRIREEVDHILQSMAEGLMPKISRSTVDPELYDELESLGFFANGKSKRAVAAKSAPKTPHWTLPPLVIGNNGFPVPPTGVRMSPETLAENFAACQSELVHNSERLHKLESLLDEDDIDRDLLLQYTTEKNLLMARQHVLMSERQALLADKKPEAMASKKRSASHPPAQTPIYNQAKKKAVTGSARRLVFNADQEYNFNGSTSVAEKAKPIARDEDDDIDDKKPLESEVTSGADDDDADGGGGVDASARE